MKANRKKLFEKQMNLINQRWPNVAKVIKKAQVPEVEIVLDPITGLPNATYKIDGKKIMIHSPDPIVEANSIVNRPENRFPAFTVFLGLGLGYYPLAFLNKKKEFIRYMLIIEKDPGLVKLALQLIDLTPVLSHPGCTLAVGLGEELLYPFLRSYMEQPWDKVHYAKVVKMVLHEPSVAIHKDYYLAVIRALRDAIRETLLFFGNDPKDSLTGLDNIIRNIPAIVKNPGIKDLKEAFKNKPAICVASGPSLKKNVDLLKDIQDKAVIICCDASLKPLLKRGIKPHIVTALERVPEVVPFFEGIPQDELKDTWLASCPVVVPEVYTAYQGPHIITYRSFAHFEWLGIDKGMLKTGPSCANMSFKIAEFMGCNPIVLIGQDLAFAETGESHISDNVYGDRQVKPRDDCFYVPGNYTEKVLTTPIWYMFLKHFELDIANYKGICINATEGGARINGTLIMSLKEVIEQFIKEKINPTVKIRNSLKIPSKEEIKKDLLKFKERLNISKEFTENMLKDFKEVKEKVISYINDVVSPILSRNTNNLKKEEIKETVDLLNKINTVKTKYITDRNFYLLYMHIVQPYLITSLVEMNAIYEKYENLNFAKIEIAAKHKEWFEVMISLIEVSAKRIEKAMEITENLLASI